MMAHKEVSKRPESNPQRHSGQIPPKGVADFLKLIMRVGINDRITPTINPINPSFLVVFPPERTQQVLDQVAARMSCRASSAPRHLATPKLAYSIDITFE